MSHITNIMITGSIKEDKLNFFNESFQKEIKKLNDCYYSNWHLYIWKDITRHIDFDEYTSGNKVLESNILFGAFNYLLEDGMNAIKRAIATTENHDDHASYKAMQLFVRGEDDDQWSELLWQ